MRNWKLHLLGIVTLFSAGGLAILIGLIFGDTYFSLVPLIAWFVWGQIYLVPKILGRNYRWGLFLFCAAMMVLSAGAMAFINEVGGGWFSFLPPILWVIWANVYVRPRIIASEDNQK